MIRILIPVGVQSVVCPVAAEEVQVVVDEIRTVLLLIAEEADLLSVRQVAVGVQSARLVVLPEVLVAVVLVVAADVDKRMLYKCAIGLFL